MRAAIGLLRLYALRLSQMSIEAIAPFLMRLPEETKAADVFANIAAIKISHSSYTSICQKFKFDSQQWQSGGRLNKLFTTNKAAAAEKEKEKQSPNAPPIRKKYAFKNLIPSFLSSTTSTSSTSTSSDVH
jgi:hypothetical protein